VTDPRTPAPPEFAAWPPAGWGATMPWQERLTAWRRLPRKERIAHPGTPRLRRDPRPLPIDGDLVWSHGACTVRRYGTRSPVMGRGFWLLSDYGDTPRRIESVNGWLAQLEAGARGNFSAEMQRIENIRAAINKVSAVEQLSAVAGSAP